MSRRSRQSCLKVTQVWHTSAHIKPRFVEIGPHMINIGPDMANMKNLGRDGQTTRASVAGTWWNSAKMGQVKPNFADTGPNMVDIGPDSIESGPRMRPNRDKTDQSGQSVRIWSSSVPNRSKRSKRGRNRPKFDRIGLKSVELARVWPNSARTRSKSAPSWVEFGGPQVVSSFPPHVRTSIEDHRQLIASVSRRTGGRTCTALPARRMVLSRIRRRPAPRGGLRPQCLPNPRWTSDFENRPSFR